MNVRERKRIIGWAAAMIALGGVVVLAAGLMTPVQVAVDGAAARSMVSSTMPASAPRARTADGAGLTLAELQSLCARDLRKPLFDAPPAPTAAGPAPSAAAAMGVRLLGTVAEPGHSMAILQTGNSSIEVCGEGQKTDGAGGVTVVRIDHQKVIVMQGGQSHELTVPPPPTSAPGPEVSEP